MTENAAATTSGSNTATGGGTGEALDRKKEMAEYEAEKKIIKDAITKRAKILAELSHLENKIADLEGRYLESTPGGNILTGFDNYTKGLTGAAAQRRKVGNAEQNRVFSRSSVSYNALNVSIQNRQAQTPLCRQDFLLTMSSARSSNTSFGHFYAWCANTCLYSLRQQGQGSLRCAYTVLDNDGKEDDREQEEEEREGQCC